MTLARQPKTIDEPRTNDAEETRANILDVATREFADKGLAGARIDEIAEKTNSSKRMIYYYFGGKDGLYRAVLEQAYGGIRKMEAERNFEAMPADVALTALIGATFDYQDRHPEFVRLVMNENILHGANIEGIPGIKERNQTAIATLKLVLDKGVAEGVFRAGIDPIQLHMTISALSFFNVSNRHTFSKGFGVNIGAPKAIKQRREIVIETVLNWVRR